MHQDIYYFLCKKLLKFRGTKNNVMFNYMWTRAYTYECVCVFLKKIVTKSRRRKIDNSSLFIGFDEKKVNNFVVIEIFPHKLQAHFLRSILIFCYTLFVGKHTFMLRNKRTFLLSIHVCGTWINLKITFGR